MIITAKADGTLIKTVPDRVYQGSNNADTIVVVAPIAQTATMKIRFKKPQINEYTENFLMTPASSNIYANLGVSMWTYAINSELTQYYGTVQAQFSATINNAIVSSGAFTFEVEKGVEVELEDPAEATHTYDDIYNYLTNMSTRIFTNGELEAKAILPYDDLFAYSNGAIIFDDGDFYKSKIADNRGIKATTTSEEITSIEVNSTEFKNVISNSGTYTFTVVDVSGTNYWYIGATQIGMVVNGLSDYGIYYEGTPVEDDTIVIAYVKFPNTTNWDKIDYYSASEVDAIIATLAGRKYPLGTTGSGEIFNDYVNNVASGNYSHAEGYKTTASGDYAHTEGNETSANRGSHAEGSGTEAGLLGDILTSLVFAHAEGKDTKAIGRYSHAEGYGTQAGYLSEENLTEILYGTASHAEGYNTKALAGGHSEGNETIASGIDAHAEGSETTASGNYSHAEGFRTTASDYDAHAEGDNTTASGRESHAEGWYTTASGPSTHTEGSFTTASAYNSHAGGGHSIASHNYAFAHGDTVASSANNQAVFGIANDDDSDALFIIGNGETRSGDTPETRIVSKSNAFVVKANGDIYGGNNKQLSTKEYVDTVSATKQNVIDASHKLSADLVDDTGTTNKFVTASEKSQITTNANDIDTIEGLIPAQASTSNQLADKNFVNSSIGTNTANFIGTFENVSDLESYSGTITNNDYAFVINQELDFATTTAMNAYDKTLLTNYDYAWVENGSKYDLYRFDIVEQTWGVRATNISKGDVSLITAYNRYKYNGTTTEWNWEYTLNTSGFTANQWAAINSGITSAGVSQISTNTTNIAKKVNKETTGSVVGNITTNINGTIDNTNGRISIEALEILEVDIGGDIVNSNTNKIELTEDGVDITADSGARVNGNAIETQNNKVTSLSNSSTDTQYPSAKCVYDAIFNEKGIINLTGTQENPINLATDLAVGQMYSLNGYITLSSTTDFNAGAGHHLMYKASTTTIRTIYCFISMSLLQQAIVNSSNCFGSVTIDSSTGYVSNSSIYSTLASVNGGSGDYASKNIFAPTSAGTSGYLLQSNGTGNAPTFSVGITSLSTKNIDTAPTENSQALITSGGVYTAIQNSLGDVETLLASI